MAKLWQAIWLIGVALLLHLQLTCAAQKRRQLAQDDEGGQEVSNAEELLYAILNKADNIHFTSNFTLPGNTFPEPPATCLEGNPTPEAFSQCAPQAVVYTADNPEDKATWTADPGVVLDASYLFRGIILNRPLDLRDMTFAQIVDDLNPYFFLFGVLRGVSIAYRSCTLLSQCGGKGPTDGPAWMDQKFQEEFPLATRVIPRNQNNTDSFVYNALSKIPIPGAPQTANIQLLNGTKITCYSLPGPYPRNVAPALWDANAATTTVGNDDPDACQRPETLGADYRGTGSQTISGAPCANWNTASPLKTATAGNVPEFGLGNHNYCRNPDRDEDGVWCYAVGNQATKQRCSVRKCPVVDAVVAENSRGAVSGSSTNLSTGAFWGILTSGIVVVVVAFAIMCYCCRNRLPCHDENGKDDDVRNELQNPRTDYTVDMGASSGFDGTHSGTTVMQTSKVSPMHSEQPSAADRLEDELRKTMSDAGGESQLQWKEMIGSGAHGCVYLGVWKTLRVAIKSIRFHGPAGIAALEAYATSALTCVHANIVKTLQCYRSAFLQGPEGSLSEVLDLVHEHCEGGNLATALQNGFFLTPDRRLHNNNVMQVVWEMSVGLNYLHNKRIIHGDLNPRNVLLKGQKASSNAQHAPCLSETSTNAAVRTHYESLCEGFVVKITDFGLALTVHQIGADEAALPPAAQFYIAPEALEFGSYTDATDVYSFGVLLWELYHSQTSYKKTNAGFYIRPHMFPKFDEGAWLPYAALTVACLQEDPSRSPMIESFSNASSRRYKDMFRPSMQKVVEVLQDMLMVSSQAQPATAATVAGDGGTSVTDLIRGTLGEDIESYRKAPAWRGVLQELNGITSSHILDLLTTNHLSDIINIPAPTKQPLRSFDESGQPIPSSEGNAVAGDAQSGVGGQGGIDRTCAGIADGEEKAKITMLLHSMDELGHQRRHSVTSEDESDVFEDAKDEIMSDDSLFIAQGGQTSAGTSRQQQRMWPPWARGGMSNSVRHVGASRLPADQANHQAASLDNSTVASGTATSPRLMSNPVSNTSMDGLGRITGLGSGIMTPVTGDLVSSRSNVSMVSDWDQCEMVKDQSTGKTRFNVQMMRSGRGGGVKGLPHSSHSLSQGRAGDGMSHGHHLSSAALTSTTSGIDSNPGTPLVSQTLDADMAAEQAPMPPGSAGGTPGGSSILSTGGAAAAAAVAAVGANPSPTPSGFGDGGGVGGHSERTTLPDSGAGHTSTDGQRSTVGETDAAPDVDEEAAMDVLRWAPAARAQNQAASAARRGIAGLDSTATPSQLTASHPTSGGSNSSLSSISGLGAVGQGHAPRVNAAGQTQGLTSSTIKSPDHAADSNMHASISSVGVRSPPANTTVDGMLAAEQPKGTHTTVDSRTAASGSTGLFSRDSLFNSTGRGTTRIASGPDTGGSVNVPPLHAGRAAAHLAGRSGLSSESSSAIAVPNIIIKGRVARSFDGMKLGEYRPMGMRSDRIRSYDGAQGSGRGSAQPLSGSTKLSPGTSMRGQSEEATSRGLMGLQSLFDSAENSDGAEGSERESIGLAEVMKKRHDSASVTENAPSSMGDATKREGSSKVGKSKKEKSLKSGNSAKGSSAADKAARKAAKRAKKLQAAQARTGLDLEKLKKERGQASGGEGSPLSMRDLDVSHASHIASDTTSAAPATGSGDQLTPAQAVSAVDAPAPDMTGSSAAPPVAPAGVSGSAASVSSGSNDTVGIDLNPKQARSAGMAGRGMSGSNAGWRMSGDVIPRPHSSGRRNAADISKLQAPGATSKSGKAPVKAGLKQEGTDAAGKSTNVRMYMHPLLRNNRAAIAHVEKIQLKGTDDTSGSGTRGSSMEHVHTTSSGPQSSNARSSQARSHNSAPGSGAADRVTM